MAEDLAARLDAGRRALVLSPDAANAYAAIAGAFGASGRREDASRAMVAALLIARPPIAAVRPILDRLMTFHNSGCMSLFWRLAEEADSRPHQEILEQTLARRDHLTDAERLNGLRYLLRRPGMELASLPYVICGSSRSGGTFISNLVAEMTGLRVGSPHDFNEFSGAALDSGRLYDLCRTPTVVHGHLPANGQSLCYFRLLNVRPIVTVRNIFDALRSYADHISGYPRTETVPPTWIRAAIMRRAAFFVEFYAGWCRSRDRFETLWIDYDELHSDPDGLVERIAAHVGVDAAGVARARALLDIDKLDEQRRRALLINRGVPGRGRELTDLDRGLVRSLYPLYPDIDFRPIDPDL